MTAALRTASMAGMDNNILKTDEAAALLRIKPNTVKRYAADGTIPATKFGRSWRFNREQLIDWMKGRAEAERAERAGGAS